MSSHVETKPEVWTGWDSVSPESHNPFVNYDYEVNGKHFICSRIGYGGINFGRDRKTAERIVSKYPVGAEVLVYYDPYNPRDAVLEPGSSTRVNVALIAGILMILCGIFIIYLSL